VRKESCGLIAQSKLTICSAFQACKAANKSQAENPAQDASGKEQAQVCDSSDCPAYDSTDANEVDRKHCSIQRSAPESIQH
jgi:hypothetical protein